MMKIITFIPKTVKPKLSDLHRKIRENGLRLETVIVIYIVSKKNGARGMAGRRVSLGYRSRGCRLVDILGVRPNLEDYPAEDLARIQNADTILYPTLRYAQPLEDLGKKVFPAARQYYYLGDKIRQTTLFKLEGIPMPKSRVFYGRQCRDVFEHFRFPFVAKIPKAVGEGRGVFLIESDQAWQAYLTRTRVAYIQEYIPMPRDLRVVAVAGSLVTAYWRRNPSDFRHNLSQGGIPDFQDVPGDGIDFALDVIARCGFDDVGMDVFNHQGRWMVLEANMHYGLQGLRLAGISLADTIDRLIREERI